MITLAATGASAPVVAAPPRLVCVLTDTMDKKGGGKIAGVVSTLINRAPVQTHFTFVSGGAHPKAFFEFTKTTYPNRRVKGRAMNKIKSALGGYYALAAQNGKTASVYGGLHTPEIVEFLPAVTKSENTRVVFLGNLLFMHDSRNAFVDVSESDVEKRFRRPSYAHLTEAKRFQSAFAIPEDKPQFTGTTIQWFNPYGENFSGASDYFAEVEEFQAAYVDSFGIRLAKVRTDSSTFVAEVFAKPESLVPVRPRQDEKTITMVAIADLLEEIDERERQAAALLAKQEAKRLEVIAAAAQAKDDAQKQAKLDRLHKIKIAALRRKEEEERNKGEIALAKIDAERKVMQAKKLAAYEAKKKEPVKKRRATHIMIADHSASMQKHLDRAARAMSKVEFASGERGVLILYSDGDVVEKEERVGFVFSESSASVDLAAAFREAPLRGGGDIPEALHMGLLAAWNTLQERPEGKAEISIYTDAPGKEVGQHPARQKGYRELIGMLLSAGHSITLYRCGEMSTDWMPKEVVIKDL